MFFIECQYSTFYGTSNRDDSRTIQCNSLDPVFIWKLMLFYSRIDHGVRSNSLLENRYLSKVCFAKFGNVFMCLMTCFCAITRDTVLFKIYFKSLVFSKQHGSSEIWDCQWHKTFSVTPVFTALILLLLFQIIKIPQCFVLTFTNFFFFLIATNALMTSWVTFSITSITVFFHF